MGKKMAALFVVALWVGRMLSVETVWGQAFQLAEFTKEADLKSEVHLKLGPAFPMGDFKAMTGASGLAQGAKIGMSVDVSYQYNFVPYFGLGVFLGAQQFGYDFATAITATYPGKLHKVGWGIYTAGLSLNVRIPVIPKLYLIGNVQGAFALMLSPQAKSVEKVPILDEEGKKIQTERNVQQLIRPRLRMDFLVGAEFGLQYRILKNLLARLTVEYRYAVFANGHRQASLPMDEMPSLAFRYSALGVNVGVSYAF